MDKNKEIEVVEDMMDYIRAKGIFVKSKKDITDITNLLFGIFKECKTEYTFNLFKYTQAFVNAVAFDRLPNLCKEIEINNNENQYIMLDNVFDNAFNSDFGGGLMDDLVRLNKFPTVYSDSFILMEIRLVKNEDIHDFVEVDYRFLILDMDEVEKCIDLNQCDNGKWNKMFLVKGAIRDSKEYYNSYLGNIQETIKESDIKEILFDRYRPLEEDRDEMIKNFSYLLLCIFCVYVSLLIRNSETYKIPFNKDKEEI